MNMKKIVTMMFAALFATNVLAENVKFKVSNMNCDNCAKRVEKVLKANEAVSEVKVDLENKAVCVSYDAGKASVETIQKALTDAKFKAEAAKQCNKEGGCQGDCKEGHKDCKEKQGDCKEGHKDCKKKQGDCKKEQGDCKEGHKDCKEGHKDCKKKHGDCKKEQGDCKEGHKDCKKGHGEDKEKHECSGEGCSHHGKKA